MKEHVTFPSIFFDQFLIDSANQKPVKRKQSEDYILIDPDTGILGVFDSVGGRDNGRLVSHLAGGTIASAWQALSETERKGSPTELEASLQGLIRQADAVIASLVIPAGQKRPATTVALGVLSFQQDQAYLTVAHVGDSRVYLLRTGYPLQRLTEDNGYFPFALRRGLLSREEAQRIEQAQAASDLSPADLRHFERRNQITCAVGWTDFPCIRTSSHNLLPGDRVLLCTDGVHDNLTDQEIEEVLCGSDGSYAKQLVSVAYHRSQQAHFRAKQDDVSAIVAWYRD